MNIHVRLNSKDDADIIEFLSEKKANSFIVREALRQYISAYKAMGQQTPGEDEGQAKAQVQAKVRTFGNMGG